MGILPPQPPRVVSAPLRALGQPAKPSFNIFQKAKRMGAVLIYGGGVFLLQPTCWNSLADTIHSKPLPLVRVGLASPIGERQQLRSLGVEVHIVDKISLRRELLVAWHFQEIVCPFLMSVRKMLKHVPFPRTFCCIYLQHYLLFFLYVLFFISFYCWYSVCWYSYFMILVFKWYFKRTMDILIFSYIMGDAKSQDIIIIDK